MRQTSLFTKTRHESPKDEVSKNAELLIRAGFIHKEMAGVYAYMPLGLKVLKNIEQIVREEMNMLGGQEIELTALQDKNVWEKTGRWDDAVVDNWFKTKLKNDTELGLGYTHEAALAEVMKDYVSSYRDLPSYIYQFQIKFRNELRSKSGLFRGREFLMKDLYSFTKTEKELDDFYEKAIDAYKKIFARLGLGDRTYLTVASGGSFGTKYSHEFQTLTDAGEDIIYIDKEKGLALNKEVYNDETMIAFGISKDSLVEEKSVEVGNIYKLGSFYSLPLGLVFKDEEGKDKPVIMGSYGIGISRLMGTIVELFADEKGLVWPKAVAPFKVHLISLGAKDSGAGKEAESLYEELMKQGIETLLDDRELRPGEKFADSDLIGVPTRVVISDKTLAEGVVEVKDRKSGEVKKIPRDEFIKEIKVA